MIETLERKKSTATVEIVPVEFSKHPNADSLSVAQVFGGYSYVGRTEDWIGVKRAAYICPDNVVDTDRPEFRFLKEKPVFDGNGNLIGKMEDPKVGKVVIKARKLRGVISFGLMIPVSDDTPLGEDWTERLGVTHFEPETEEEKKAGKLCLGGETEDGPGINTGPYYDIDAARRFAKECFTEGEPVIVQEKVDGTNTRVVWHNDRLWVKSRNHWKRRQADFSHLTVESLVAKGVPKEKAEDILKKKSGSQAVNGLWQVVERTQGLVQFCQEHPGVVVFGEIFGNVNRIKYGFKDGNRFAAFDVFQEGRYLPYTAARCLLSRYDVPMVPILNEEEWSLDVLPPLVKPLPFDFDKLCEMAEGLTLCPEAKPKTIREGIVVSPLYEERYHPKIGRVKLKFVSGAFLERG